MKLKGKYEKHELFVGLSAEIPLTAETPEQVLVATEVIGHPQKPHFRLTRTTLDFELESTSDELLQRSPERARCYRLVASMPDAALPEAEESLRELIRHYVAIAETQRAAKLLPGPQRVQAVVKAHHKV